MDFIFRNKVAILFSIVSLLCLYVSGIQVSFLIKELLTRLARNSFLVLALIIPVIAGMGMNFSIVIGAMSAQAAIIMVTYFKLSGIVALIATFVLALPLSVFFGWLTGKVLNRAVGQEMITGMMLGYFANGIYQMIFLVLVGSAIIPIVDPDLLLSTGVGVRNSIDLTNTIKYTMDNIIQVPAVWFLVALGAFGIFWFVRKALMAKKKGEAMSVHIFMAAMSAALVAVVLMPGVYYGLMTSGAGKTPLQVPLFTFFMIFLLFLFNGFFLKTRLGQNLRTVGNSRQVANSAGINVDKMRITAIVISTVLAAWGQIIYLQNVGTLQTMTSHESVGLYAVAAIVVGGASVKKATNAQAIIGVVLFHTLFIVSPQAGQALFNNAQLGEFFRVFLSYGVIALALALHAWERIKKGKGEEGAEAQLPPAGEDGAKAASES
ncbi:MAG: ABC transporter permease [Clostridiales bacterium]|nr:ABC transporter permease [Clostridiales bacterium]